MEKYILLIRIPYVGEGKSTRYFVPLLKAYKDRDMKRVAETRKTTMGHITIDHLKQAYVLVPPLDLINALDNKIKPIFDSIITHRKEQQSLANIPAKKRSLFPGVLRLALKSLKSNLNGGFDTI